MIRAAIIEDDELEVRHLKECLDKFSAETRESFQITHYSSGESFLQDYRPIFDIIFLDIELKGINGIETAFKLREIDRKVVLIFVTNMVQFAIKGYEVDALDYIVKPIKFQRLQFKLQKTIELINANKEMELTIPQVNGYVRLSTTDIYYIEVNSHRLSYHTTGGIVQGYGSLSKLEQELASKHFMRCNSCYLVNPHFIASIRGLNIIMRNGDELKISQPKRKKFLNDLTDWLGQGNTNNV